MKIPVVLFFNILQVEMTMIIRMDRIKSMKIIHYLMLLSLTATYMIPSAPEMLCSLTPDALKTGD